MKPLHHLHTYKEIPDFNIIGERLIFLEDYLRAMVKNINPKKTNNPQKIYGPYLLKILLCCCICFAAHRKKMVKGEKNIFSW